MRFALNSSKPFTRPKGEFTVLVPTRDFLYDLLLAVSSGIGADSIDLANCSIGICAAPIAPTADTTYAQVEAIEANFGGYARQALATLTEPWIGPGDLELVEAARQVYRPSNDSFPNVAYALFLTGSASTKLYGVEVFDQPVPLPSPSYALTIIPRVGLDPAGNYGLSLASP